MLSSQAEKLAYTIVLSACRKEEAKMKYVFPDTNTFLHCQSVDQLDLPTILSTPSVRLVITQVVIRELDRNKTENRVAKLRKRAGTSLKLLESRFGEQPSSIRASVDLEFRTFEPGIDFDAHKLSRHNEDDHLLASVLEFRVANPDADVLLLTRDIGLKLKAHAHKISTFTLPDQFLLPEEADPNEERVKELEKRIREIEAAAPSLQLRFVGGDGRQAFTLARPIETSPEEVERKMAEEKARYPKYPSEVRSVGDLSDNFRSMADLMSQQAALLMMSHQAPTADEIARYDKELDPYYAKFKTFLSQRLEFENKWRRTITLEVSIQNSGGKPAEDVDVWLHFPDGFQLFKEEKAVAKAPPKPSPPNPPRSLEEKMLAGFGRFGLPSGAFLTPRGIGPVTPSNVGAFSIKRTNSYEVQVNAQIVKHNTAVRLDPLYVVFDSFGSATSFEIEYKINSGNVPKLVEGTLHVIVNRAVETEEDKSSPAPETT